MTNMYLLWEWTEEREAKVFVGIYSSIEKAKDAADLDWKHVCSDDRGATEEELALCTLGWREDGRTGYKSAPADVIYMDDEDLPYCISEFTVDTWYRWNYSAGKNEEVSL